MIRGTLYGSIAAAFAITLATGAEPRFGLILGVFAWMFLLVVLVAGLPLLLAAAILRPIQEKLRQLIPGRLFVPVAVLSAVPFALLVCVSLLSLVGRLRWDLPLKVWVGLLRVGIAGGLGLGLGTVRGVSGQD